MLLLVMDDSTKLFKFRNSWGDAVGAKGYQYLPYDYITNKENKELAILSFGQDDTAKKDL